MTLTKPKTDIKAFTLALQEVRIEISRVNEAAGQTVFNPAATEVLDSVIRDLS